MTCKEYQNELGNRIKQYRIAFGLTQQQLEEKSGVSARSISRLEQGASIQMDNLIKILSSLKIDENLLLLVPDQTKRPSYYLNNEIPKQRFRKKEETNKSFKWGDEK